MSVLVVITLCSYSKGLYCTVISRSSKDHYTNGFHGLGVYQYSFVFCLGLTSCKLFYWPEEFWQLPFSLVSFRLLDKFQFSLIYLCCSFPFRTNTWPVIVFFLSIFLIVTPLTTLDLYQIPNLVSKRGCSLKD